MKCNFSFIFFDHLCEKDNQASKLVALLLLLIGTVAIGHNASSTCSLFTCLNTAGLERHAHNPQKKYSQGYQAKMSLHRKIRCATFPSGDRNVAYLFYSVGSGAALFTDSLPSSAAKGNKKQD